MHSPSGLFSLPIQFYFKNHLHLLPDKLSYFGLITAIPLYLSFIAGLARDAWKPKVMGDRGYLLIGGLSLTLTYLAMAFTAPSWSTLLIGTTLLSIGYLVVSTASNSLTTLVGQQRLMTGRLSALWNIVASLPAVISYAVGGKLADNWSLRNVFLLMAIISASMWLQSLWASRDIFVEEPQVNHQAKKEPINFKALFHHKGAMLAALIWMMWNFAPGANTATLYYLTDKVHLSDAQYGNYQAVFTVAFIPLFLCYGYLCRKFTLRKLLFWGTIVAVPQLVPILFIHSAKSAYIVATLMGVMGAIGTAAYYDLLIRACPKRLEGTLMMIAVTGYWVFGKWGDVLGSKLYGIWGYLPCVIATTTVYAAILIVLAFLPKSITDDKEEQLDNRVRELEMETAG